MKIHRILLLAAILLLIYPSHAASQQERQEPPAPIGGRGGSPRDAEMLKQLRKEAEQGDTQARVSLGSIYIQGIGVPPDFAEAAKWFRKAAEQGDHIAQSMLGSMHTEGLGVTKDYIEAYMWLTLSVAGSTDKQSPSFQKATDLRDSFAEKMTPQQIAEAQRLGKEWRPKVRGQGGLSVVEVPAKAAAPSSTTASTPSETATTHPTTTSALTPTQTPTPTTTKGGFSTDWGKWGGTGFLKQLLTGLSIACFIVAIFVCPAAVVAGVLGWNRRWWDSK